MERLEELLAELKAVQGRLDVLLANDTLTDEERAEHDQLVARHEKLVADVRKQKAVIVREEERIKAEAEAEEARALVAERQKLEDEKKRLAEEKARRLVVPAVAGRITDPDRPAPERFDRSEVIPSTVKRFAVKNFKGVRGGREAEARAYRFGQWILSRLAADLPNRFSFPAAADYVKRQMAAVTSADGSGYQFLIPEEFGQDIIDLRETYGVVRRLFKTVPMDSDTRVDPRRQSGLTAYFVQEGSAGTESNKVWNQVRLTAKDLMVLSRYTNQVNADSVISVGDDLAGEIAYAFANKEDQCGINGDGTSTYGGIVGVRTKLVNVDGAGTASAGVFTQGTGNTWGQQVLSDFNTVAGKLPQYADMTTDVAWVVSRQYYFTVMQRLELAAGGNTVREVADGDRRGRPLFLGFPVEFSQVMPTVTATTGVCALLGNFMMGASFGDRQQNSVAFSEHATVGGENVFERNEIAIRGTERMDINVHDVGDANNAGPIVGLRTG